MSNQLELHEDLEKNSKLICINFPGYLKDDTKTLELFGDINDVKSCIKNEKSLKLKFDSKNPFSIGIKSTEDKKCGILIKCKKNGDEIQSEIIGLVEKSFKFNKIADMQINNEKLGKYIGKIFGSEFLNSDDVINFAPRSFAAKAERKIKYEKSPLDFTELFEKYKNIPMEPIPIKQDKTNPIYNLNHKEALEKLKEIFSKRPVCTKSYVESHSQHELKPRFRHIYQNISYYQNMGPYKYTFCPFDIDPATSNKYALYQTIELGYKTIKPTEITENYHLFTPNFSHLLRVYQYCDIKVDSVINLLKENLKEEYHPVDGWFSSGTKDKIRNILKEFITLSKPLDTV